MTNDGGPRPSKRRRVQEYEMLPTPPDSHPHTPSSQRSLGDTAYRPDTPGSDDAASQLPSPCDDRKARIGSLGREVAEEPSDSSQNIVCFGMVSAVRQVW